MISSSLFAGPRLPMVRIDAEQCRSAPVFEADWRRQATSVFVFPGTGCHRHPVEPKKGWQRTCKAVGIQGARIHDLRRTMGSRQAKTGAGLPVIGKNLNHKNQSATAICARLDLDPVRSAMEKAAAMLATRDQAPKVVKLRKVGGE